MPELAHYPRPTLGSVTVTLGFFHYTRMVRSACLNWYGNIPLSITEGHSNPQPMDFQAVARGELTIATHVCNERTRAIRIISARSRHQALLCNRLIQHVFQPNEWDARLCHHTRSTTNEHAPLCVYGALDGHCKGVEARHCLPRMLGHQTQKRVSLSGIELIMKRSNPVLD
jgi:hypothetical protein